VIAAARSPVRLQHVAVEHTVRGELLQIHRAGWSADQPLDFRGAPVELPLLIVARFAFQVE